ncbi:MULTISPECIES: NAD(+)/NADH kinase [Halobacterium]|uniref:NAD(+)/NADH kinase n=1 Tax=Halobacterium TaxID=2239 RepID=UPI0019639977|nr:MULTISPECIES: NAD(+)/NADH kinase [Halobacterium]MCF2166163.1 NAD(+)/NADH kinase [Halobacterium salinarum]MCF2167646.1 NAD(+)/NADH kinase [Halobacterium salinarum]MDL0121865.1 NAD(+)/NADH kinase [Halobacterium salinarum]MDL0125089.1 NAD(+)/NADH kinase [Halobacterium salinarum]MDL0128258.1 NAD(+)/NADH kinase [Halobacterium salinarum]
MHVGIVAQRGNERATSLAGEIREQLRALEVTVWVDTATAEALACAGECGRDTTAFTDCDLVVSIGGDGTFLFAARGAGATPILGVNLGEVGFLNAVAPADAVEAVREEVNRYRETGAVRCREVPRVVAAGDGWASTPALNEVAIQGEQRGHGHGVAVDVRVDGSQYEATRADGVLVATPTGSTAYNLSEGGPLVQPSVDALVVTEMCGADALPPLVTGLDSEIRIRVETLDDGGEGRVVVASDGGRLTRVDPPVEMTVTAAAEPARVAGPAADFFEALSKLE